MKSSATDSFVRIDPMLGLLAAPIGWVPSLRFLLRRERLKTILARIKVDSMLEIGCGSGSLLIEISKERAISVHGLETSIEARKVARQIIESTGTDVHVHNSPQSNWTNSFDVVCAFEVLEHIENDETALEEWVKWISPGGALLVSVPAHRKRWSYGDVWAGHYRRYDFTDLHKLIQNAGLRVEYSECYGFPLANITELLGNPVYKSKIESDRERLDKNEATAGSGIKRDSYLKLFRWINNSMGRTLLRAAFIAQGIFKKSHLGSGYIILARKP